MLYGLYQSATGADLQALKMDVVSNNIANAGTSSFKRDLAIFSVQAQQSELDGEAFQIPPGMAGHPGMAVIAETYTDFSQGPLDSTGGQFDVALMGPGFLRVTDGSQEYLTRKGALALNAESELVQADTGYPVLDEDGGRIVIPPGTTVQIQEDGVVAVVDPVVSLSVPVARLDRVQANQEQSLVKMGEGLYLAPEGYRSAGPELRVRQGYLEQSGVQPVKEMLAMIETSRAFEANMNLIQHQEHTLGLLLQSMSGK